MMKVVKPVLAFSFLALLSACGDKGTTPPPSISVTLTPNTASVRVTRTLQLSATVHNSTNGAVTWSLSGTGCSGVTCGTISNTGFYTAPANVPSPATVTVKATSAADTSKSASATITILPAVVVTVSPLDQSLDLGATLQFTATVQNAINSSVVWSISGVECSGAECGTISTTGLYTAPSGASAILTIMVTATSMEDPTVSGSTTVVVVTNAWIWVSGSNTGSQVGIYGTKGMADPANVPGARGESISWIDSGGKLWLFGGEGLDSAGTSDYLNDLWKYDPTTLQWTWVSGSKTVGQVGVYGIKGVANPANIPGARGGSISWIDSGGKLWLFGGRYNSAGLWYLLNDLWKYDPLTLQWTWVSGSDSPMQAGVYGTKGIADAANIPGARMEAISWIDSSGKLWLFGGWAYDSVGIWWPINDLWKYDPTISQWTWVSGSNNVDQAQVGTYGAKGVADPANVPGARHSSISWIDANDKLWLFGGMGQGDDSVQNGLLNDLWKFDPTTLQWTWVSGSNDGNQPGIFGTKGVSDPANIPGGRRYSVAWIDGDGRFWLFGGVGYDSVGLFGSFNDLWKYDPTTLQWTWVSGSNAINPMGIYGTKGIADPANVPGGRAESISWIDSKGRLWLFGGYGCNDLWKYIR